MMSAPPPPQPVVVQHGIVKQALSGDTLIVRGPPRGGPPQERTICLSNVTAPRLARRPNPSQDAALETKDEPYAWEAREFLRKKLVGKEVCYTVEYKAPGTGREYGAVYVGRETSGENLTESIVAEGLVEVRRGSIARNDEKQQKLIQLEETAKAAGLGKWSGPEEQANHIRDVSWTLENPRHYVDSQHGQPIEAIVEHVRDGCTIRAFVLPSFQYITVMMSGIKCPMFKIVGDKTEPEVLAEEAKFYTESRLLQRNVQIVLEGASNQNLLGSVLHPNGSIALFLLRDGFARCADWSMRVVTQGVEKLRAAQKEAKEKRLRLWKDYTPPTNVVDIKDKNFTAKVTEVINADGMVLKLQDGSDRKVFLSSVRFPRTQVAAEGEAPKRESKTRSRPLYDIPYLFEAREFLRKKLVGKKVNVVVDYIQPKTDDFPEKTLCTVTVNNINIAEALVSKGFAMVVRYRQDDDQRSAHYDDLQVAEERAKKKGAGLHSKRDAPTLRVADVSGDVNKAKQFFPFLQRAGRCEAIVEFVASGSRLRLYIPRETCLITVLLAGISCPRASRPGPGGVSIAAEPFGEEALAYTKEHTMQREVEVEVDTMDKGGNFIGWVYVDGLNVSVGLVDESLAQMHFSAERSSHFKALSTAQEKAKAARGKVWANWEEPVEEEQVLEAEPQERKITYKTVVVTEVTDELHFYAQNTETGTQLEKLMEQFRADMTANPPLTGAYTPKKGEMCAAKFSDGEWYRAKVQKVEAKGVHVLYIDYGNREMCSSTKLAALPAAYNSLPPQATEYCLACINLPTDTDDIQSAIEGFYGDVMNKQLLLNTEYRVGSQEFVSLLFSDNKEDVVQGLISEGLLLVEKRREKRLAKLMDSYRKAQDKAKKSRLNLWQYGDFTDDDAKEFGFQA